MVEVFKTNVTDSYHAQVLIAAIHKAHSDYLANFDLDDCDRILRIDCNSAQVQPSSVIAILNDLGFTATLLRNDQSYDPFANLEGWN
jgi:hypothetical protein